MATGRTDGWKQGGSDTPKSELAFRRRWPPLPLLNFPTRGTFPADMISMDPVRSSDVRAHEARKRLKFKPICSAR